MNNSLEAMTDVLAEECPYDMFPVDYSSFLRQVQNGERVLEIVVASRLKYGPEGGDVTLLPKPVFWLAGKIVWEA